MMKIIVNGTGAMAQKVAEMLEQSENFICAGFTTSFPNEREIPTLAKALEIGDIAGIIDFSHPDQLNAVLSGAVAYKLPLLLATTGYTDKQLIQIEKSAATIPIVQTYNTSIGIAVLEKAVKTLAKELRLYETDIVEIHHNKKIDAPSGTALKLKNAVLAGRGGKQAELVYNRRDHPRKNSEEIGMQSLRLGNVYGEHSVYFAKDDELIEVKHTALSKNLFAKGAVDLMERLLNRKPGLYTVTELL